MMKKLLVLCICFVGAVTTLQAQGGAVAKVAKGTKHVAERTKRTYVKPDIVVRPGTAGLPTSVATAAERQAAQAARNATRPVVTDTNLGNGIVTDQSVVGQKPPLNPAADGQLSVKQAQDQYRAALEAQKKRLEDESKRLLAENQALKFQTDFGKSVLLAPVPIWTVDNPAGFSMTVIKTFYKGQEEIFGVIPSHSLIDLSHGGDLGSPGLINGKIFNVQIKDHFGKNGLYRAEVVQFAPASLLDISLVKFLDPEVYELVKPLELSLTPASLNEILFSYGYADGRPHKPIQRIVQANSFLSVRTDQNLTGERAGFCGSPLLDSTGRVKAIHTGTREMGGDTPDVSYGTHAKFVQLLIDAYHNDGKAEYNLELDGQVLASLNVNEYISYFAIYDSTGKLIHQKNLTEGMNGFFKFSESEMRKLLQDTPDTTYLFFRIRHSRWNEEQTLLKPVRVPKNPGKKGKMIDPTKREHWYNLQTQQIEPTRPAVIKM